MGLGVKFIAIFIDIEDVRPPWLLKEVAIEEGKTTETENKQVSIEVLSPRIVSQKQAANNPATVSKLGTQ